MSMGSSPGRDSWSVASETGRRPGPGMIIRQLVNAEDERSWRAREHNESEGDADESLDDVTVEPISNSGAAHGPVATSRTLPKRMAPPPPSLPLQLPLPLPPSPYVSPSRTDRSSQPRAQPQP